MNRDADSAYEGEDQNIPTLIQPMRQYAGVTIFFNPRWVVEINKRTRPVGILRHDKFRWCRQRVIIIHTLTCAYHIPLRWWIEQCDPSSYTIHFSMVVGWYHDIEHGNHILECYKQHRFAGHMSEKMTKRISFSYLDIERIEHQDGTVLWQKKR